jgi:hypothetical protein
MKVKLLKSFKQNGSQPISGRDIAGFTDEEISPLFEKAHDVENIVLPPGW